MVNPAFWRTWIASSQPCWPPVEKGLPSLKIYFFYWKWGFSIVIWVYQRVTGLTVVILQKRFIETVRTESERSKRPRWLPLSLVSMHGLANQNLTSTGWRSPLQDQDCPLGGATGNGNSRKNAWLRYRNSMNPDMSPSETVHLLLKSEMLSSD